VLDEADSDDISEFVEKFRGSQKKLIRPLVDRHLYAAMDKTPDSILAIVGEVVKVDPELLQREVPQRFQISWSPGVVLEVKTEAVGKPTSRIKNTMADFRRAIQLPFGVARITVKMNAEDALTLYRASQPGLPTLIYPSY
jgi:hypothetical protein